MKFKFKVEICVLQISVDHKFGSNICNIKEGSTRPFYFLWFDFVNIMIVSMCSLLCDLILFMGNNVGR